jgi:CrcB protein
LKIETILAIGSGGFVGAVLRGYFNGVVNSSFQLSSIPLGTLFVNLTGSLLIGFFLGMAQFIHVDLYLKSFLVTGFLGALTTFSTFSFETLMLLESSNFRDAFLSITFNIFGTILFAYIGFKISKYIFEI